MIIGFANGCFDVLHDGHRHFLRECMMNCDKLYVALNSDLSIERRKGRPRQSLAERAFHVGRELREGDSVMYFEKEGELADLIRDVKPDVLFKGEDYYGKPITGADLVKSIHWIARHPGYSTSLLSPKEHAT